MIVGGARDRRPPHLSARLAPLAPLAAPSSRATGGGAGAHGIVRHPRSTLCDVLERIPAAIRDKVEEVVVFDDASQDRTYEVGTAYQRRTAQDKLAIHHTRST